MFVDTLDRSKPYEQFGESWGSYPVLRVHDHAGGDLAGRIDGNLVRGRIPVSELLDQMNRGLAAFGED